MTEAEFMKWFMTEPPVLEWLQILYRIKMAENGKVLELGLAIGLPTGRYFTSIDLKSWYFQNNSCKIIKSQFFHLIKSFDINILILYRFCKIGYTNLLF